MDRKIWIGALIALVVTVVLVAIISVVVMDQRYSGARPPTDGSSPADDSLKVPTDDAQNITVNDSTIGTTQLSLNLSPESTNLETSIDFSLIVLSAGDQKAVILTEKGQTQLVAVGDSIGADAYEVLQITNEKLVLKHARNNDVYWLFEREGLKKGRIQKFSSSIQSKGIPPSSSDKQPARTGDK